MVEVLIGDVDGGGGDVRGWEFLGWGNIVG